jgi:hypothetical protein
MDTKIAQLLLLLILIVSLEKECTSITLNLVRMISPDMTHHVD